MPERDPSSELPDRIGPYRILDVLGEGGMAVVYLAEQAEPVRRQVAIKVLKLGMDTGQFIARFEFERQALAVLDHANIQKVFGAGTTDAGRPYFVTEVVHGVSITEYCDANRLDTTERLRLFIDVCSAVQHAHQKGVIHRDLKPSNVLVGIDGDRPQVKVIDFGVAKAVGVGASADGQTTRIGQLVGTPHYMSPEQAAGSAIDVDTRTDVYSLGIMLYELLVGALPFDLTAVTDDALPFVLREREPSRPSVRLTEIGDAADSVASSRRTDIGVLRNQLRGDLDWIVMKAIEKDRARRYETANALALDCGRYLGHQPVLARPPSAGYLMKRFVRRNRAGVVAASFALVAILLGAATAVVGMLRAVEAQHEAEAARDATGNVVDAMIELLGDTYATLIRTSAPLRTPDSTGVLQNEPLRYILNRTEKMVARTLVDQPDAGVRVLRLQGTTNFILGRYDESEERLEAALADARAAGLEREELRLLIDLAQLAERTDESDRTLDYLAQARSLDAFGDSPALLRAEADIVAGEVAVGQNDYDRARTMFTSAIELLESTGDSSTLLGDAYWHVADAWLLQEEIPEAQPWLQKAIDLYVELEGPDYHALQRAYSSYGWTQQATGNYEAALENFERAHNVVLRNFGSEHPFAGNELNNMAMALNRLGRYDEAVATYEKAIELLRRVTPASNHHRLAGFYSNLGNANANRGAMRAATQNYRDGLATAALKDPPDGRLSAFLENNLGRHLVEVGELEVGIEHLREAVRIKTEIFGADNVSTARSKLLLVKGLAQLSRFEAAAPLLSDAAAVYASEYRDQPHMLAFLVQTEGDLEFRQGRLQQALQLYVDAYNRRVEKNPDAGSATTEAAGAAVAVAAVLTAQGQSDEALEWLSRAQATLATLAASNQVRIEAGILRLENGDGGGDSLADIYAAVSTEYPAREDWLARLDALSR